MKSDTNKSDIFHILKNCLLFRNFSENELAHMLSISQKIHYPSGQTLIREGDKADSFFILEDGRVEVLVYNSKTQQQLVVTELGEGQVIGELSILGNNNRSSTVRAIGEVDIILFKIEELSESMRLHLHQNLADFLAERLRRTNVIVLDSLVSQINIKQKSLLMFQSAVVIMIILLFALFSALTYYIFIGKNDCYSPNLSASPDSAQFSHANKPRQ